MEVRVLNKKKKNTLDREEYGHGYDLSPDDFDVIGQNNEAKKHNQNENKDKRDNKHNPSRLNQ
ncbi:hypothetical protein CD33_15920 [Ureibacillus sinduriensis BLB-1 = JCM 15800]|uniref:Uncharacterized protein n=1 Tax=Ureibacillus sinduriensis BLB-1 = JCM 15800 TaxID=1384057 RepID=A0A0A3HPS4_9BACL|nr:hypothetical protein [Ureibacillus sinduriensis]KGR74581.1 hypothetical protein CD33_15920 [Ureibacillus sinduriensis BLB-1 = JCM 15800]